MCTSTATPRTTSNNQDWQPRVWLVAGACALEPAPDDMPVVRDTLMHTWRLGADGLMHMTTVHGHRTIDHHASWADLRARYDLVEVA